MRIGWMLRMRLAVWLLVHFDSLSMIDFFFDFFIAWLEKLVVAYISSYCWVFKGGGGGGGG